MKSLTIVVQHCQAPVTCLGAGVPGHPQLHHHLPALACRRQHLQVSGRRQLAQLREGHARV